MQMEAKGSRRTPPERLARLPRHLPRLPNQLPRASQPLGQLLTQPLLALSRQLPPARLRHLLPTQTPLTWRQQRPLSLYPTATSIQASIFLYKRMLAANCKPVLPTAPCPACLPAKVLP